jgi:hypothetical protein
VARKAEENCQCAYMYWEFSKITSPSESIAWWPQVKVNVDFRPYTAGPCHEEQWTYLVPI